MEWNVRSGWLVVLPVCVCGVRVMQGGRSVMLRNIKVVSIANRL